MDEGNAPKVIRVPVRAFALDLVGGAFGDDFWDKLDVVGVFGEGVGDAIAIEPVRLLLAGGAPDEVDGAALGAEHGGGDVLLLGEGAGDGFFAAGDVVAHGELGGALFGEASEGVFAAFGLGFALAGAGMVDAGELAVGVAAVGAVGDGGFFGGRGEGVAEGPGEGLLDGGGHLGVVGEQLGKAPGEGLGGGRGRLRQERPQVLGKGLQPASRAGRAVGNW